MSAIENNEDMAIEYNDEIPAVPENEVEVETENQTDGDSGTSEIGWTVNELIIIFQKYFL